MKTILVTGGAGFIGRHLVKYLLDRGDFVIVIDDFSTGRQLEPHQDLAVISQDIRDPINCVADEVYNLACPASPEYYQLEPVKTGMTSAQGMLNVLTWARDCGAKVLQASTSEVYGDPEVHPQREDYLGNVNSLGPRACYDEGKRFAEALCYGFWMEHGLESRIVRIFNTYGPGMRADDGRVMPNFITSAIAGLPLVLHDAGEQTRSFCYVSDTVRALVTVMESGEALMPYNVGNPEEVTISDLADMIIDKTDSESGKILADRREDDPVRRCPDIQAIGYLGWSPVVSLEDGVTETIEYFRSN